MIEIHFLICCHISSEWLALLRSLNKVCSFVLSFQTVIEGFDPDRFRQVNKAGGSQERLHHGHHMMPSSSVAAAPMPPPQPPPPPVSTASRVAAVGGGGGGGISVASR